MPKSLQMAFNIEKSEGKLGEGRIAVTNSSPFFL
jgi:hypothetical protein